MASTYEFWLCDDAGRRMYLFSKIAFASYSRSTNGYGTIQLGLPYNFYLSQNQPLFKPDWRLDVWRSPGTGMPARREGSFLLRKFSIYQRETDEMMIYEIFGRSPIDILRRQHYKGTADLTDNIDDIMKAVVRNGFTTTPTAFSTAPTRLNGGVYTYTGEFAVDADSGDGPSVTGNFYLDNILDICRDLNKASITLNASAATNKKIYFDVVEDDAIGLPGGFGYRFRTYPNRFGKDRTTQTVFSVENGNLAVPVYYEDYQDEITSVFKYNSSQTWLSQNAQSNDKNLSRWNYIEKADTTNEETAAAALSNIYTELNEGKAQKIFNADFLNSPGSAIQPRSLYGVDWDLGDLLPVKFASKSMNAEVAIVYVGLDDQSKETITGKTQVGA